MNAEGYHLIYNRPFVGTDVKRETPIPCFAGLCIAFLVYTRAARERFCPAVGNREFSIGYVYNHHTWGLFSTTWNDGRWNGYNEKDHNGFPANTYHYVYYYFKDDQTLHVKLTNDVFELRTGSVITVFGKYKKSSKGNNRYE
ncbi:hypothetical protein V5799_030846 [Amblyomma americanum]|uniref:Uncharacterized protein n=1 Tax=Amblyomma americanum TaxID=6943 RepID=A0AAQ4EM57_AMBAM